MKKVSETEAKKILLALSKNPTFCNDEVGEEIKSVISVPLKWDELNN